MKNSLLLILIFVLIYGCAEKVVVKKDNVIPAERLIVKLEAKNRKIKSFYGSGKLVVESPTIETTFDFIVKYKKPDSLSIEAFGPFGIEIANFLISDDYYKYWDVLNNKLYKGKTDKKIIQNFLGVNLSTDELKTILLGTIDFSNVLRDKPQKYQLSNGEYELSYNQNDEIRSYKIEESKLQLVDFELATTKDEIYSVDYLSFKKWGKSIDEVPYLIKLWHKKLKTKIEIQYKSIKINSGLNSLNFKTPSDVLVIE